MNKRVLVMSESILLLMESPELRKESFGYAVELAARTESQLVVLIALPVEAAASAPQGSQWAEDLGTTVQAELGRYEESARSAGVTVQVVLRIGDQPSAVLKYLAGANHVRAVVWGGQQDVIGRGPQVKSPHWLARVESALDCPLVGPTVRNQAAGPPTGHGRLTS
jgi:hypothetical protein